MPRQSSATSNDAERKPTITGTVSRRDHYLFNMFVRVNPGLKVTELAGTVLHEWIAKNCDPDKLRAAEAKLLEGTE